MALDKAATDACQFIYHFDTFLYFLLGIAGRGIGLKLPAVWEKPIGQVASSVTPAALLIMGASFNFRSVKENLRDLIIGVTGKLIISPVIVLSTAYLLGILYDFFSPYHIDNIPQGEYNVLVH